MDSELAIRGCVERKGKIVSNRKRAWKNDGWRGKLVKKGERRDNEQANREEIVGRAGGGVSRLGTVKSSFIGM